MNKVVHRVHDILNTTFKKETNHEKAGIVMDFLALRTTIDTLEFQHKLDKDRLWIVKEAEEEEIDVYRGARVLLEVCLNLLGGPLSDDE